MEVLSTADINLAVLEVNEVTNSKSELKWIEAASLGIPSVVSNTSNYLDVIEDGKTGLIASNQQEWQKHLEHLIKNSKLREEIGNNALVEVESKYNTKVMSERIDQILTSCLANFNSNDEA
jgi:glycosyltransferase involved in cell wall biosynthesis